MLKNNYFFILFTISCLWIFNTPAYSRDLQVIKNPSATMIETKYTELIQFDSIKEDLGSDHFLFNPYCLTCDKDGNIYVYDNLQAKIYLFDPSLKLKKVIGRKGKGPGEFSGTGSSHPVKLKVGLDGNLYAADVMAKRIKVFTKKGRYIKDIEYQPTNLRQKPIIGKKGNLLVCSLTGKKAKRILQLKTQTNSVIHRFGPIEEVMSFLFYKPAYLKKSRLYDRELDFTAMQMTLMDITSDGKILFYLPSSSILYIFQHNNIIKKLAIWPREALVAHKKNLNQLLKKSKEGYRTMFFNFFVDGDDENRFYLQMGLNENKGINALYKFNQQGKLLTVLYIKHKKSDPFTLFKIKKNQQFFATREERVIIFKEEVK